MSHRDDLGERMAKMETDITYIKERVDETHSILQKTIADTERKFENFRKESDDRYASKLVEKFVYGLVGAICMAVLVGLLTLVLR